MVDKKKDCWYHGFTFTAAVKVVMFDKGHLLRIAIIIFGQLLTRETNAKSTYTRGLSRNRSVSERSDEFIKLYIHILNGLGLHWFTTQFHGNSLENPMKPLYSCLCVRCAKCSLGIFISTKSLVSGHSCLQIAPNSQIFFHLNQQKPVSVGDPRIALALVSHER